MAAQPFPCGNQGLRVGPGGIGDRASQRLFKAKSPAKPRDLRRNGPVRVQFALALPACLARSPGMNPAGARHIAVLGRQAFELLSPRDDGIYVDATFGAGGYSWAILNTPGARIIGIDRDR